MKATSALIARSLLILGAISLLAPACGPSATPTYVRDTDVAGLDEPAMSLGLDARDIDRLFAENMYSLQYSPWYTSAGAGPTREIIAVMPIQNQTTEHVSGSLDALISRMETAFTQDGRFDVVAYDLRQQILDELHLQQGAAFDQSRALPLGRQLGVHYFVTGRLYDNAERTAQMRRVQYFMFMQVVDVMTGVIVWQNEANLSKGVVPME